MKTIILIIISLLCIGNMYAQEITIVTEELPPYQIDEGNNKVGGLATEIVQAILKEAGETQEIIIYPWARAYKMALEDENVLIYSLVRSQEREPLFKWVGKLIELKYCFFGLESENNVQIQSIEQARQYKTGVSRDSFEYQELDKRNFNNLTVTSYQNQLVPMLFNQRFDFIFGSELSTTIMVKDSIYDHNQLKKYYEMEELNLALYIAFSINTSDAIVSKYREAYNSIIDKGIDLEIKERWLRK